MCIDSPFDTLWRRILRREISKIFCFFFKNSSINKIIDNKCFFIWIIIMKHSVCVCCRWCTNCIVTDNNNFFNSINFLIIIIIIKQTKKKHFNDDNRKYLFFFISINSWLNDIGKQLIASKSNQVEQSIFFSWHKLMKKNTICLYMCVVNHQWWLICHAI